MRVLLLAYVLFGLVAVAAVAAPAGRLAVARRIVPFAAAVALVLLGMKLPPSLFALALIAGGSCYALGLLDAATATARRMRRVGFALCFVALAIPNTITLALPLAALLLIEPVVRPARSPVAGGRVARDGAR